MASTPPSPRLSARRMKTRYLNTTTRISAQNTRHRMPYTFAAFGLMPYSGENVSRIV